MLDSFFKTNSFFNFQIDELIEAPPPIDVEEIELGIDVSDMGIEPEGFDVEALNKERQKISHFDYVPIYYKFPEQVPPLKKLDEVKTIIFSIFDLLIKLFSISFFLTKNWKITNLWERLFLLNLSRSLNLIV